VDNRRQQIEARREALELSRAMLAQVCGLTPQVVYKVERTEEGVRPATIDKLWHALDAREAELTAARGTGHLSHTDDDRLARLEAVVADLSSRLAAVLAKLDEPVAGAQQQPGGLQGLEPRPPTPRSVR